jgi:hypothetical protein
MYAKTTPYSNSIVAAAYLVYFVFQSLCTYDVQ